MASGPVPDRVLIPIGTLRSTTFAITICLSILVFCPPNQDGLFISANTLQGFSSLQLQTLAHSSCIRTRINVSKACESHGQAQSQQRTSGPIPLYLGVFLAAMTKDLREAI